jgi:hypothetical protein
MKPAANQPCSACGLDRRLIGAEPATADYEIGLFECPRCKTVVRLVQPRRHYTNGHARRPG